eukprot:scaffold1419_cov410-Prasinococcus_capsulatus_cf.AAC.28
MCGSTSASARPQRLFGGIGYVVLVRLLHSTMSLQGHPLRSEGTFTVDGPACGWRQSLPSDSGAIDPVRRA